MKVRPHDRFSSQVVLTPESVASFARAAGDNNPVHFDASFAAQTRYRQLIARGKHANVVTVAIARELAGFMWAIAKEVPVIF